MRLQMVSLGGPPMAQGGSVRPIPMLSGRSLQPRATFWRPVPFQEVSRPLPRTTWQAPCLAQSDALPLADSPPQRLSAQDVLANVRLALGTMQAPHNQEMVVSGMGRHLGISIQWRIRWRTDGAFREVISGKELGFEWGYDGQPNSNCWEMDSSGVARSLECDDHEALLVGAWVRTGLWLQPELSARLDIQLLQDPDQEQALCDLLPSPNPWRDSSVPRATASPVTAAGDVRTAAPGGPTGAVPGRSGTVGAGPSRRRVGLTPQQALLSAMSSPQENQPLVLTVRLIGGKLVNRIRVCPYTWAVQGLDQPLCGDTEVWQFGAWKAWQTNVLYPEHASHQAIAGGHHVYLAQACTTSAASPLSQFQCPDTPVLPGDTSFLPGVPPELPVWRAGSGHLLVRPHINGLEGGYMVVDTGASGFVITPNAAMSLGLDAFGELFAASIAGKIPAQFVKARSWSLGPLHISSPVMMTMPLDGLVRGAHQEGT